MGIFDLNENAYVIRQPFMGSNIYYIDDFYKTPDVIVDYLNKKPGCIHHPNLHVKHKSLNGKYFDDRRHVFECEEILKVYDHLSTICGQPPIRCIDTTVRTNQTKFFKNDFNNFKENYWYPHWDPGYNGLVYFNKYDNTCGTNLYRNIHSKLEPMGHEHVDPWKSKRDWKILKTITAVYNRCVLFDGKKFPHGMHIPNDTYFGEEYRLNQGFFFEEQ